MISTSQSELLPTVILPGSKVRSNVLSQNTGSNFGNIFTGFNSNSLDIHSTSHLFSLEDEKFESFQFDSAFLKGMHISDNDHQAVNLIDKSSPFVIEPKITTMKNLTADPKNHLNMSRRFGMKSNHTRIKGERNSAGSIEKTHGKTAKNNAARMEMPIDVRKSTMKGKSKQAKQHIIRYSVNSFEKVSVNKITEKTTRTDDKIDIRNTAKNNNFEIEQKSIKSDNLSVKSVDNSKKENYHFKVINGKVQKTVKLYENVYHGLKVNGKVNHSTIRNNNISPLNNKIDIRNTAKNNNFEIEQKSIKSDNLSVKSVDNSKKENHHFKVINGKVQKTVKLYENVYHGLKVNGKVNHSTIRNNNISPLNNKIDIRNTNDLIINSKGSIKQIEHNEEYRKDQAASQDKIIKQDLSDNPNKVISIKKNYQIKLLDFLQGFALKTSLNNPSKNKKYSNPIKKSAEKNIKRHGLTTDKTIHSRKSKIPVNPLLKLKEDITSKIGKNTKISNHNNLLKLSEINTGYMSRFDTPLINSTGLSSLALIQRISQTIYQSIVTNQTQANFTINGGHFGSFEFRYNHDQVGTHVTVVVESEATRSYLQKIIPTIIENLYRKGILLDSLEVQVGFFDQPNTQERNDNTNSRKVLKSNKQVKVTDVDNKILKIRDYGYNTMEILA